MVVSVEEDTLLPDYEEAEKSLGIEIPKLVIEYFEELLEEN